MLRRDFSEALKAVVPGAKFQSGFVFLITALTATFSVVAGLPARYKNYVCPAQGRWAAWLVGNVLHRSVHQVTPNDKLPLGQTRETIQISCLLQGEHSYIQDKMIDKARPLAIASSGLPVQ